MTRFGRLEGSIEISMYTNEQRALTKCFCNGYQAPGQSRWRGPDERSSHQDGITHVVDDGLSIRRREGLPVFVPFCV